MRLGTIVSVALTGALAGLVAATGCHQAAHGARVKPAADPVALMKTNGCLRCHVYNGEGGGRGPDLTHEGASGHDASWLAAQIGDPRTHSPGSRMPAFKGRMPDADITAVAAALAASK